MSYDNESNNWYVRAFCLFIWFPLIFWILWLLCLVFNSCFPDFPSFRTQTPILQWLTILVSWDSNNIEMHIFQQTMLDEEQLNPIKLTIVKHMNEIIGIYTIFSKHWLSYLKNHRGTDFIYFILILMQKPVVAAIFSLCSLPLVCLGFLLFFFSFLLIFPIFLVEHF